MQPCDIRQFHTQLKKSNVYLLFVSLIIIFTFGVYISNTRYNNTLV